MKIKECDVCFTLQHFRESEELSQQLEVLIEHATQCPTLTPNEKNAATEVSNMYHMQLESQDDQCPVMQLMNTKEPIHLVRKQNMSHDCHMTPTCSRRSRLNACCYGIPGRRRSSCV